jgi:hypothetical protein
MLGLEAPALRRLPRCSPLWSWLVRMKPERAGVILGPAGVEPVPRAAMCPVHQG